jgi:hypothetical protein
MNRVRFAVLTALAAVVAVSAGLFGSRDSGPTAEAQSPHLEIVTLSPIIVQDVLDLVQDIAPFPMDVYDSQGLNRFRTCMLALALRTATGDAAGAARLNPPGDVFPCQLGRTPPGELTPDDFSLLGDLDGNQISENAGQDTLGYADGLILLVFDHQALGRPALFEAPAGNFWTANPRVSHGKTFLCELDTHDADCTQPAHPAKNGIINVALAGPFPERGEIEVKVSIDNDVAFQKINIVGDPARIGPVLALSPKLEVGGASVCRPDGNEFTFANLLSIPELAERPDAGVVAGFIEDSDGTPLTLVPVEWESLTPDIVITGFSRQFSLESGGLHVGPNLACSGDTLGTGTLKLLVRRAANGTRQVPQIRGEVDLTVVGRPAQMVAYADPEIMVCDGTNTTNVNAVVMDAWANHGVAGRDVRFDVLVRGSADPIVAQTNNDGTATSVVTPLTDPDDPTGVSVTVTGPFGFQQPVLIQCVAGVAVEPPDTPPAPGEEPVGVTPPRTGVGYAEGAGALSWWPALALLAGAVGLGGARLALRRS